MVVLKQLRKQNNKTQAQIAKYLGITQQAYATYELDTRTPPLDIVKALADYFNVSVDHLLGRVEQNSLPKNAFAVDKLIKIPVLGSVRAGYGGNLQEELDGYEMLDLDNINGHSSEEYFWLRVSGDSMSPEINDNDLVLVHKQTSVDSGKIAVIGIDDNEAVVKKVIYEYGKPWLELHSFNPYYPPRRFEGEEELSRVFIIGLVKESKKKW